MQLTDSVTSLGSIAKRMGKQLKKLGIHTIEDLLFYFPVSYEDYTSHQVIKNLQEGQKTTVIGTLTSFNVIKSKVKKIWVIEALLADDTGSVKLIWFNQPFLAKQYRAGDVVAVSGVMERKGSTVLFTAPLMEKWREDKTSVHTGRILPTYGLTAGLTNKHLRYFIESALPALADIDEWLPNTLRDTHALPVLNQVLRTLHYPSNIHEVESARRRMQFDELLLLQLYRLQQKLTLHDFYSPRIPFQKEATTTFVKNLPFTLTEAQKKAAWQIMGDMEASCPMNRLLEGDVGSGKTVVAALVIVQVVQAKKQAAFLAPTEILAEQHFNTVRILFAHTKIAIVLVTRNTMAFARNGKNEELRNKKKIYTLLAQGDIDLVIGTHALLEPKIAFDNLALVIIDEQHRFGVAQRKQLREKMRKKHTLPHLLSMTATPIPRTLALTVYGDLDLSLLDELPQGRKPVETSLVAPKQRADAYDFIRDQVAKGGRVFIVCPLIDPSDTLGVKSVTEEYEKLSTGIFTDIPLGVLHGKLKSDEKERVLKDFLVGKVKILVTTSVVEVGVDVPDATVMVIEGAERFGLAQLHQFRGRVGRSNKKSYCLLFTDSWADTTRKRLAALVASNDGFALAQKDLEIRGPGSFSGMIQSGFSDTLVNGMANPKLVTETRNCAEEILKNIETYPEVKKRLKQFEEKVHLE